MIRLPDPKPARPKNIETLKAEAQRAARSLEMKQFIHLFYAIMFGSDVLRTALDQALARGEVSFNIEEPEKWTQEMTKTSEKINDGTGEHVRASMAWGDFLSEGFPSFAMSEIILKYLQHTAPQNTTTNYVNFDTIERHRSNLREHARVYSVYTQLALNLSGTVPDGILWTIENARDTEQFAVHTGLLRVVVDHRTQKLVAAKNEREFDFLEENFDTTHLESEHVACGKVCTFDEFIKEIEDITTEDDDCAIDGTEEIDREGKNKQKDTKSSRDRKHSAASALAFDREVTNPNSCLRPNPSFIAYVHRALAKISAPMQIEAQNADRALKRRFEIAFMALLTTDHALESLFSNIIVRVIAQMSQIIDPAERGIGNSRKPRDGHPGTDVTYARLNASIWQVWEHLRDVGLYGEKKHGASVNFESNLSTFFEERTAAVLGQNFAVTWRNVVTETRRLPASGGGTPALWKEYISYNDILKKIKAIRDRLPPAAAAVRETESLRIDYAEEIKDVTKLPEFFLKDLRKLRGEISSHDGDGGGGRSFVPSGTSVLGHYASEMEETDSMIDFVEQKKQGMQTGPRPLLYTKTPEQVDVKKFFAREFLGDVLKKLCRERTQSLEQSRLPPVFLFFNLIELGKDIVNPYILDVKKLTEEEEEEKEAIYNSSARFFLLPEFKGV